MEAVAAADAAGYSIYNADRGNLRLRNQMWKLDQSYDLKS